MRIRIRFTKHGKVRFTSHRDVARVLERSFRKAGIPLAHTQGFTPRPRISFGLALPTGYESDAEYLDADLHAPVVEGDLLERLPHLLTAALPAGIEAVAAAPVPAGTPSLQEDVVACSWTIEVRHVAPDALDGAVRRALDSPTIEVLRTRKGQVRRDDIRPAIEGLVVAGSTDAGAALLADLATHPRGLRPAELVAALGESWREGRVRRRYQWIVRDGARCEPLPVGWPGADAPSAARPEARAS